ncbi:hypothetical protein KY284_013044 [Solanum tuberosum]|nr:hypothetical protein KY284_013044 [Solanum tuberosum]
MEIKQVLVETENRGFAMQLGISKILMAEFDRLLNGINLSNENAISCFLGGLKPELNKAVRAF